VPGAEDRSDRSDRSDPAYFAASAAA